MNTGLASISQNSTSSYEDAVAQKIKAYQTTAKQPVSGDTGILLNPAPAVPWHGKMMAVVSLNRPEAEKAANRETAQDFFNAAKAWFGGEVIEYAYSSAQQKQLIDSGAPLRMETVRKVLKEAESITTAIKEEFIKKETSLKDLVHQYAEDRTDTAEKAVAERGDPEKHSRDAAYASLKVARGGVATAASLGLTTFSFLHGGHALSLIQPYSLAVAAAMVSTAIGAVGGTHAYLHSQNRPLFPIAPLEPNRRAELVPGLLGGVSEGGNFALMYPSLLYDALNPLTISPVQLLTDATLGLGGSLLGGMLTRNGITNITHGLEEKTEALQKYEQALLAQKELSDAKQAQAAFYRPPQPEVKEVPKTRVRL